MHDAYLGVDPGASGAAALITPEFQVIDIVKFTETENEVSRWFWTAKWPDTFAEESDDPRRLYAVCEKVNAMPKQGVSSSFKFGASYGFCRGVLAALDIRRDYVRPAAWQKTLGCLSRGDKNVTKAKAAEWFPGVKVTHAMADALLLAAFARKTDPTA